MIFISCNGCVLSSAKNLTLFIIFPLSTTPTPTSFNALAIIISKKVLNNLGDWAHPCSAPTMVSNQSVHPYSTEWLITVATQLLHLSCIHFELPLLCIDSSSIRMVLFFFSSKCKSNMILTCHCPE